LSIDGEDIKSLDNELVGDDEAVPLSSSSVGVIERFSGCIKACLRFAMGNTLIDDSFRFPLRFDIDENDSFGRVAYCIAF
jgi:hypothetical protein